MLKNILSALLRASSIACLVSLLSPTASAIGISMFSNPACGAGVCNVDGFDIFGAQVGTPLEVDVTFADMQHIELLGSPSTNIEFGIGNTVNKVDLPYRIVFDLSDMQGNLITDEQLVVEDVAPAGFNHIVALPLTPLPPNTIFHDFHIAVETNCPAGADCSVFDLRVAGGGGDPGTFVSGPIRFNRALKGVWVPEPSTAALLLMALAPAGVGIGRRRRSPGERA